MPDLCARLSVRRAVLPPSNLPPVPVAARPSSAPRGYFGVLFALGLRRPYWDKRVNYLDCFCCLTILLLILSSLYFNNGSFLDENVLPLSKVFCSIRT